MTPPRTETPASVTPATTTAATSRWPAVATGLSFASTLAYFMCSDGIRNYLLLMAKACAALVQSL